MGKIYLAGKLNSGEQSIADFGEELKDRGHELTFEWWDPQASQLPTPYLDHPASSERAAIEMEQAVSRADTAVILFPTPTILGAAIEFGVGIATQEQNPDREILVVSPEDELRQSVFYAHPAVVVLRSLAQVRQRHWY